VIRSLSQWGREPLVAYTPRMLLVVNPAAAGGRLGKQWPRLSSRLVAAGLDSPSVFTRAPGHASELAARAVRGGERLIVAAGGDGTICEVVQGLHDAGGGVLGILPLGTGNDAARTVGVPLSLEAAAQVLLAGATRRIDLIRVGDRVVVNAIGVGLLGAINVNAASIKVVRGITAYLGAAVGTLFSYRCPTIALTNGSFAFRGRMTILAIHNGITTGGGFRLAPAALPDDGTLDACLVEATSVPGRFTRLVAGVRGTLGQKPGSHELRFTTLELATDVRLPCHYDGNPSHIDPPGTTFEVAPGALHVVTAAP
jgi:diacylglycerol kinase (ATP)